MRNLLFSGLFVIGCSTSPVTATFDAGNAVDASSAAQDQSAPPPDDLTVMVDSAGVDLIGYSDVGGPCDGFTTMPKKCIAGLHCKMSTNPDVPGTCEKPDGG